MNQGASPDNGNDPGVGASQSKDVATGVGSSFRFAEAVTPPRDLAHLTIGRNTVANLRGGPERELSEIHAQVAGLVDTPEYRVLIERGIENLGRRLLEQVRNRYHRASDARDSLRSNQDCVVDDVISLSKLLLQNALEHFQNQDRALADRGGLRREEIHFDSMFGARNVTKRPLAAYIHEHFPTDTNPEVLMGELSKLIRSSLESVIVIAGESQRYQGPKSTFVALRGMKLDYLAPKKGDRLTNGEVTLAKVLAASGRPWEEARGLLAEIAEIPRLPLTFDLKGSHKNSLHVRLRKNLAMLMAEHPDASTEDLRTTVRIVRDLVGRNDIEIHPMHLDNDLRTFSQILRAVQRGELRIACLSCPDYSGVTARDEASGRTLYKYDFRELGTGAGLTAFKGFDFVLACKNTFDDYGIRVSVDHFETTFEVANGFISSQPGEAGNSSHLEAVERLRKSGLAVANMYRMAGVLVNSRLSSDVIPDDEFAARRDELVPQILSEAEHDPKLARLMEVIAQSRRVLYEEWHPPHDGESPEAYGQRLTTSIIPRQLAEYRLAAEILRADSPEDTLIVCYDSPAMWESMVSLPFLFGQGKNAINYQGA